MIRRTNAWKAWLIGVAAVAALGATGCHSRAVVNDARMERYRESMLRDAARDTGCSPGQLTPMQISAQPAVFTVTGCAAPIEYWLQCSRRRRCRWQHVPTLNEAAAASLGCAPQMVQQQPSQAPNVRFASGCGRTAPFTMTCNGVACGWAQTGPVAAAAAPGPVVAQPPSGGVVVVPQQQPQGSPPPNAVQTQVLAQREAILSYIDDGTLTLHLRWTADGQVVVEVPPALVGTAAEGCVQAVLGGMRVQAQASGEVVVPIQ
jgi:hypothetical protein